MPIAALKSKELITDDIASRFGFTEWLVRKRLAIANLTAPLLTAYRTRGIDGPALRLLTLATRKWQKEWLALFLDTDQNAPTGYRLNA